MSDTAGHTFAATIDQTKDAPGYAGVATVRDFPDVTEVMLRVLTPQGAEQIALLEDGKITGDWWTIATANSRVFTRRVVLNPSPL